MTEVLNAELLDFPAIELGGSAADAMVKFTKRDVARWSIPTESEGNRHVLRQAHMAVPRPSLIAACRGH